MRKKNHRQSFWDYHNANPQVYTTLVAMARQYRRRRPGIPIGIGTLWECLRWEYDLNIKTEEEFQLDNDKRFKLPAAYRAYYARLMMVRNPDLKGLFQLNRSQADEDPILNPPPDPLLDQAPPTLDEMLG